MGCASSIVSPDPIGNGNTTSDVNFTSAVPTTTPANKAITGHNKVAPVNSLPPTTPINPQKQKTTAESFQTPIPSEKDTAVINFASGLVFTEAKQRLDGGENLDLSTIFNVIKRGDFRKFQLILHEAYKTVGNNKDEDYNKFYYKVHYVKGMWDSTPLLVAVQYHQDEIVNFLLQHLPPNSNQPSTAVQSVPFDKMKDMSISQQHSIVDKVFSPIDIEILAHRNEKGASVLLYAAMEGMQSVVKQLLTLQVPADIDPTSEPVYNPVYDMNMICTPLSISIINNHQEIMKMLLDGGCDTNQTFHFPTIKSTSTNSKGVKNMSPILLACHYGHLDIIRELLDRDCFVNKDIVDDEACNVLHHLSKFKGSSNPSQEETINVLAFKELIAHDVNVSVLLIQLNQAGDSPLHIACDNKHLTLVKEYLAEGADPSLMNNQSGFTPLHIAVRRREADIVRLLLENGADPFAKRDPSSSKASGNSQSPYEMSCKLSKDSAIYKMMQEYVEVRKASKPSLLENSERIDSVKQQEPTLSLTSEKISITSSKQVEEKLDLQVQSNKANIDLQVKSTESNIVMQVETTKAKVDAENVVVFEEIQKSPEKLPDRKEKTEDIKVNSIMDIIEQEEASSANVKNNDIDDSRDLEFSRSGHDLMIGNKEEDKEESVQMKPPHEDPITAYMNTIVTPISKTSTHRSMRPDDENDDINDFSMILDQGKGTPFKDRSKASRTLAEEEQEVSFDVLLLDMLATGKGEDKLDEYLVNHTMDYSSLEEQENALNEDEDKLVMLDISFDQDLAMDHIAKSPVKVSAPSSTSTKSSDSNSLTPPTPTTKSTYNESNASSKVSVIDLESTGLITPKKGKKSEVVGIASTSTSGKTRGGDSPSKKSSAIGGAATTSKAVPRPPAGPKQQSFKRRGGGKADEVLSENDKGSTKITMESKTCEKPPKANATITLPTIDQHTSAIATPVRKPVANTSSKVSGKEDGSSRTVEFVAPSPTNSAKKPSAVKAPSPSKASSTKGKSPLVRRKVNAAQ